MTEHENWQQNTGTGTNSGDDSHSARGRAAQRDESNALIVHRGESAEILSATQLPEEMLSLVRARQAGARAESTREAYRKDWAQFVAWCVKHGYAYMPADPMVVAAYLAVHAEVVSETDGTWFYAPSTLNRWLAAINFAHGLTGNTKPGQHSEVAQTIAGIKRDRPRDANKAKPLLLAELTRILERLEMNKFPEAVVSVRDAALLTLGWAGANRRSEIVGYQFGDMELHPVQGIHAHIRRSKTDQEQKGLIAALPYGENPVTCPVCAFHRWTRVRAAMLRPGNGELMAVLRETDIHTHTCRDDLPELDRIPKDFPVFPPLHWSGRIARAGGLGTQAVQKIVQKRVSEIGLDPAPYSGHSLRAGFVTQALANGVAPTSVANQTHHKDVKTVLSYQRHANPLTQNAVTDLGL